MKQGVIKCPNCNQAFDATIDMQVKPAQESNYLWLCTASLNQPMVAVPMKRHAIGQP